jgi:hypothetical protein
MMKVYCKNCKYNWSNVIKHDYCTFNKNGSIYSSTDNHVEGVGNGNREKSVFNKHGDCLEYKRKWWKVWA